MDNMDLQYLPQERAVRLDLSMTVSRHWFYGPLPPSIKMSEQEDAEWEVKWEKQSSILFHQARKQTVRLIEKLFEAVEMKEQSEEGKSE